MKKRLLACLLTAAMLVSLFPLPALAAEAERPKWMVTAFDPLDGDIAAQTVPQSGEPVLPDSLTAWAYVIEDDTAVIPPPEGLEQESEQPQTDGPEEAEDNQLPVDGQEGPEDEQLPAEKQEPVIQPVTIPGVTWEAQPEFAPDAPGEYVYTPVLPAAYEVAGEVELPVISVTVTAAEQTALQRVQAMIDALPAPEDITAENRAGVEAQLEAIGEAWAELSEEDALRLDTARLEAARDALAALDGQTENELPAPLASETGDFTVTGGTLNTNYSYENSTLTIKTSADLKISGSGSPTTDKIVIQDGITANVTLENVSIDVSSTNNACAFMVGESAACNLTLQDTNTLKSGRRMAGLQVAKNASLIIAESSAGSLKAYGGQWRAGIGGSSGNITINGGTITATGGSYGAGIGGGDGAGGGTITINGGVVHAIGSDSAAGIGEGVDAPSGTTTIIKITGGTVIAEGAGGVPGLGGEKQDCQITITGGTVNAIGQDGGPHGNGCGISCRGELNINGDAFVYASARSKPAINEDNKTNLENWKGIVFEDSSGMVYGKDVTLTEDAAIPQGKTLTIPSGSKLTIPNNVELVLEGSIRMEGQLEVNGTLSGSGTVYPPSDTPISNCTINYFDETATAGAGCQVKTDRTDWGSTVQIRPESTIYVRSGSGIAYGFQLPSRPGEPTGLQAVPATAAGNDGRITGVSTAMEYCKYSEGTWMPCTGTEITGLAAGEYLVRYKATETAFASYEAYVAVRAAALEQGFCLNDGDIYISDDGNGGIMVKQNGTEYTVSNGEIRITGSEESTPHTISVDDVTAHITLSNVKQDSGRYSPLEIWSPNVRLTLEGNNTMLTEDEAIYVASASLTIDGPGTLTVGRADKRVSCGIYTSGANVTIDGGVLNIYAQNAAIIGWYDDDALTVNGGVIRGDVSGGGRSYSGLGVSGNPSNDSIDITINGGTVELTGSNNKIYADSGTVVITGGSVTAGGVAPAPTNGTDLVYAVTVEGIGSGTVDALLLKKDGAVQNYGLPACTTTDGKLILYLPEGTYSGTAIVGGKLVTFNCEASSGAASPSTATDTGVTITTPEGEKPTINVDGTVDVPGGSAVQTGDGPEITVGGQGGTVDGDGGITVPGGGNVTVKGDSDDTTITLPSGGGTVKPNPDGTIPLPGGSTVQTGENGPEITVGDKGGKVDGDGGITVPDGGTVQTGNPATTITPPNGGKVNPKEDGTVEVPEGTTVKPGDGGPEIIVGPGNSGTIGGDGGVTVEGGGKVTVKDDSGDITITLPSGGGTVKPKPDGTIPLPGGAKVEQGGQEITVPDGGGTYHPEDGTVTKDVCTVTFDSQGGSAVTSIIVTLGEKATKPGNPTKSGYTFDGWYKESGCTTAWNFDTDTVTGNITLYAKWTATSDPGGNPGGNGGGGWYDPPTTYSVTTPTTAHGKVAVSPTSASRGATVTITAVPEDGYRLDTLNVTSGGKSVPLTEKGNGKYTFTMPAGTVKVTATFVPAETPETPWNNPFADVSEGDWYYEAVQFVQERGLMNGYSDGRFGPNDTLSRAQLAQILFNKEGRPGVNYLMDFSDVAGEAWYTEAIRWATSQGIVGGYGNGTFGPNDPITREQLAVMLWRYSGSPAATNKELHFNDTDEISPFALEALRWAVENGILNGYGDGRLGPQGQATRAQVAQMLKNFIENQEEENT